MAHVGNIRTYMSNVQHLPLAKIVIVPGHARCCRFMAFRIRTDFPCREHVKSVLYWYTGK